jgi:formylglycine-generating enzyme required for sulfatase activity
MDAAPPPDGADLVEIPATTFAMGSDRHYPEEAPAHEVAVDAFAIERTAVTNLAFAKFVRATGYVTVAETPPDAADYPDAPPENLVPGSLVFRRTRGPVDLRHLSQWWVWTPGACWHRPEGHGSDLRGREDHPVVHVACADVEAYAAWAGRALPTEAEWEVAARGGLASAAYTWGDEPEQEDERRANYWHGQFPWRADPGYGTTTPVGSFPPNGFGLADMAGNTWEWTADWYTTGHDAGGCCPPPNPRGGSAEESVDPAQPQFPIPRRVVKGGSFLCADSYCHRYRPAARRPQQIDTGTSHVGFRCVVRAG